MKTAPLVVAGGLAAALLLAGCQTPSSPSSAPAKQTPKAAAPASPTFQPGPGIRCDRRSKLCTWGGTPSSGITRLHFGDGAAEALTRPPAVDPATGVAPPVPEATDPIFKPSAKESCDTLVVTCYDQEGASVALTQQQFGDKAAQELQVRLRSTRDADRIIRYQTITCDNLAGVCYDRLGAGYGLTRLYLGESQGDALLERLQASPQT